MSQDKLMKDFLRFNDEAIYCTFDFETEDVNLVYTKPWQFACVVHTKNEILTHTNEEGEEVPFKIDMHIWWDDLNMSKGAEKVTRFDAKKYQKLAKDNMECLTKIQEIFRYADYVVGHNLLGFDIHVYRNFCYRLGVKPLPIHRKLFDTLALGKGIKLDPQVLYKSGENVLAYQMRMIDMVIKKRGFATLKGMCDYYEVDYNPDLSHDALYDVEVNSQVWNKMLWDIDI